jgi:cytochrome c oxidase cbb3-type subunit I/II
MVNGLLTMRGVWDRVREDAILKFMVVALTGYGMATFEGPMLSLKNVNAIGHFTDWIVAHVHIGALAWNGFFTFAMFYWMFPRMFNTKLYSTKLANVHFWVGTLGILFYAIPMYWSGFTQGLMWKQFNAEGSLQYPNFLETVNAIIPMYAMRGLGGLLYLAGVFIMIYNLWKTVASGKFTANEPAQAMSLVKNSIHEHDHWHRKLERKPVKLAVFALIAILIGTAIELIPTFLVKSNIPTISSVKPYTALELQGRDLYIREGCVGCHSQMIRPFRSETERYGEYAKAGEYVYDHPFLWGSKRTGPDLLRVGGKYPDSWHYNHMLDPTSMSPGSIMPAYPWLFEQELDNSNLEAKISAMRTLGVPYPLGYEKQALADLKAQSEQIVKNLKEAGIEAKPEQEIIALIAYLQRLGTDIKVK